MDKKLENQPPEYKYVIAEEKENTNETLVLKTGLTAKFSLNDIMRDIEYFKKKKTELEAKKTVEEATMTNVLRTYPEVEKADPKLRIAYLLYERSFEVVRQIKEQLELVNRQLDEEAVQIDAIAIQTGLKYKQNE